MLSVLGVITKIGAILSIGALDWLRGQGVPEGTGALKKVLLGAAMSLAMGLSGWWLLLGTVLCAMGFTHGWGTPMGAALGKHNNMQGINGYEKWQKGTWLRTHAVGAMAFRGLISALWLVPLMIVFPAISIMLVGLPVAFSVSTQLSREYVIKGYRHTQWKNTELIRGLLIGMLCVGIGVVVG